MTRKKLYSIGVPSNVHIGILRGLPCRLDRLRLKFTHEPSLCRWGFGWVGKAQCLWLARRIDAAGSIPDFSRVFHDICLLGICLEILFSYILICQQNLSPCSASTLPSAVSRPCWSSRSWLRRAGWFGRVGRRRIACPSLPLCRHGGCRRDARDPSTAFWSKSGAKGKTVGKS